MGFFYSFPLDMLEVVFHIEFWYMYLPHFDGASISVYQFLVNVNYFGFFLIQSYAFSSVGWSLQIPFFSFFRSIDEKLYHSNRSWSWKNTTNWPSNGISGEITNNCHSFRSCFWQVLSDYFVFWYNE